MRVQAFAVTGPNEVLYWLAQFQKVGWLSGDRTFVNARPDPVAGKVYVTIDLPTPTSNLTATAQEQFAKEMGEPCTLLFKPVSF